MTAVQAMGPGGRREAGRLTKRSAKMWGFVRGVVAEAASVTGEVNYLAALHYICHCVSSLLSPKQGK